MNRWLVKLTFNSPLHLGKSGIGIEAVENVVRSDTLFSAICHAWAVVYGKDAVSGLLNSFMAGNAPFRISSSYPFKGETYFLPRPQIPAVLPEVDITSYNFVKELNRLSFITLDVFKQWIRREKVTIGSIPALKEKLAAIAVYHRVPRVQLDRLTSLSGLFHSGMMVFREDAGLYFIVDSVEKKIREKLEGIFTWLGENGLGGLRNQGYGKFVAEWIEPNDEWMELLDTESKAGAWCLLSLVHPSKEERRISLNGAYFEIITREGWAASPFTYQQVKRKSCIMFTEGSVLPYLPSGSMVNVTPYLWDGNIHQLCRYGYAFAVPVEVRE